VAATTGGDGTVETTCAITQPDNDVARDCWRRQALLHNGRQDQALEGIELVWLRGEALPRLAIRSSSAGRIRAVSPGSGSGDGLAWRWTTASGICASPATLLPEPDQATARLWLAVDDNPRLILEEGRFAPASR